MYAAVTKHRYKLYAQLTAKQHSEDLLTVGSTLSVFIGWGTVPTGNHVLALPASCTLTMCSPVVALCLVWVVYQARMQGQSDQLAWALVVEAWVYH